MLKERALPDGSMDLAEGWNLVLISGISRSGWRLCLRIRDEAGDGSPAGVSYAASRPAEEQLKGDIYQ